MSTTKIVLATLLLFGSLGCQQAPNAGADAKDAASTAESTRRSEGEDPDASNTAVTTALATGVIYDCGRDTNAPDAIHYALFDEDGELYRITSTRSFEEVKGFLGVDTSNSYNGKWEAVSADTITGFTVSANGRVNLTVTVLNEQSLHVVNESEITGNITEDNCVVTQS